MTWELALTGLLIGGLVGVTGMGGGSLLTPILVLGFGFKPIHAIGTDILHGAIFKTVGAVRQRRLGNVKARLSGWMLLGSAPTSLIGVAVAAWIERRYGGGVESVQGTVLGAVLLAGGAGLLAKGVVRYREQSDAAFRLSARDRVVAVCIGLIGGFVVGLTSVGSGVFFALTMLLAFPLRSAKVVGTDIFHAAALLWVAGLGHLATGHVQLDVVAWLLAGSIPGVLIGSQFTVRLPERMLRGLLAGMLVLSGLALLEVHPAVLGIAALAVLGLATATTRLPTRPRKMVPALSPDGKDPAHLSGVGTATTGT